MSKLFSKSYREKGKGTESQNLGAPINQTASQSPSASSSIILESHQTEKAKKGFLSNLKDRFKSETGSKKQSPDGAIGDISGRRQDVILDEVNTPAQPDTLLIERVTLNLPDDPNYQRKLEFLDMSIEVVGLFEEVSKATSLGVPDTLGLALKGITVILERLKVSSSNHWRFRTN